MLSFICKLSLIAIGISLIGVHYMIGKVWFNQIASYDEVVADLKSKADPNAYSDDGLTGLMLAAVRGDPRISQALIAYGANVDLYSREKYSPQFTFRGKNTALHLASYNGSHTGCLEVAHILIENNANPRLQNSNGDTALLLVPMMDNQEVRNQFVRLLVKNGADINAQNKEGYTLLHKVVEMGDLQEVIAMMNEFGPLINYSLKNKRGLTPYDLANVCGLTDIAAILTGERPRVGSSGDLLIKTNSGLTQLMIGVIRNDIAMVKNALGDKSTINAVSQDEYQYTALQFAELYLRLEMVSLLMENGASLTTVDSMGNTPVHTIVRFDKMRRKGLVDLMINAQNAATALNAKNKNGDTLMHLAVKIKDAALVEYLLYRYKAVIAMTTNNNGKTPLDIALDITRDPEKDPIVQALKKK